MYLAYLLIFMVGVVGNMLVLVVVFTNSHMQTTTNMYLVNLSAADILMCLGRMWVILYKPSFNAANLKLIKVLGAYISPKYDGMVWLV